jgi:organic radical activating enzyme
VNKVIPIKLDRESLTRTTKVVEWRLSNLCNFNCSFCPSEFKDGSKKYLSYQTYIDSIDRLINNDTSKKVWFQFTGGEPTLYPKLTELFAYIKNKGGYTSMISNGSRTIRWWKELAELNVLDRLYLTYHPEQEDGPEHIIEVNDIMQDTDTFVTIFVTTQSDPVLFKKAEEGHNLILNSTAAISSLKPVTLEDTTFQPYTDTQLKIIQNNLYVMSNSFQTMFEKRIFLRSIPWYQSKVKMTYSDNTSRTASSQFFIEHQETRFKDWECDIGKDSLMIEIDEVYRGMCRQGGVIGLVNNTNWTWESSSIICQKEECNCSFDVQEPKRLL